MAINLSTILNTTSPNQLATAWVRFNGYTGSIVNSYNISSITKNATGDYTINFTSAQTDANYCFVNTIGNYNGTSTNSTLVALANNSRTNTTALYNIAVTSANSGVLTDSTYVASVVFGT